MKNIISALLMEFSFVKPQKAPPWDGIKSTQLASAIIGTCEGMHGRVHGHLYGSRLHFRPHTRGNKV